MIVRIFQQDDRPAVGYRGDEATESLAMVDRWIEQLRTARRWLQKEQKRNVKTS